MKIKKTEAAAVLALILCIVINMISFGAQCAHIKSDVLRMHIIANSDSAADQRLKLSVRDALLERGYDIFDGARTLPEAKKQVIENMEKIQMIVDDVLKKSGSSYTAKLTLGKAFFDTRYYESFTLPAGEYEALKVVIGEGKGHNWWCVMFPQLCLAASDNIRSMQALTDEEKQLILSNPKIEVRFKCVEIYEKLKKSLKNH